MDRQTFFTAAISNGNTITSAFYRIADDDHRTKSFFTESPIHQPMVWETLSISGHDSDVNTSASRISTGF